MVTAFVGSAHCWNSLAWLTKIINRLSVGGLSRAWSASSRTEQGGEAPILIENFAQRRGCCGTRPSRGRGGARGALLLFSDLPPGALIWQGGQKSIWGNQEGFSL